MIDFGRVSCGLRAVPVESAVGEDAPDMTNGCRNHLNIQSFICVLFSECRERGEWGGTSTAVGGDAEKSWKIVENRRKLRKSWEMGVNRAKCA